MAKRKRASVGDIKPGKWFWLEYDTYFNGEGGVSCPAKVTDIKMGEAHFKLFGGGLGLSSNMRGQVAPCSLTEVKKGKAGIFLPDPKEFKAYIEKEAEWAKKQKTFLDGYIADLNSATL